MKTRTQFNVRLAKSTRNLVKTDRRANRRVTNDIIVEVALEDFFSRYSPDERSRFYRNHGYEAYTGDISKEIAAA